MKRKNILVTLLALLTTCTFTLSACNNKSEKPNTQLERVYSQYVIHAQANGNVPLSYEEWLESIKGEQGKSAYEIWLDNGHTGSQADFLEWLKGENGKSAYEIWLDNGHTGTEEDF